MLQPPPAKITHRLVAATALHRGDRSYQQDQVAIWKHPRVEGCVMAVLADGMGGKSGGRKAADQVLMTAHQTFERIVPGEDDMPSVLMRIGDEAHTVIKLTAIAAEEEPHATIAAFVLMPDLACHWIHAGDSRIHHFRERQLLQHTRDHSYVQQLMDEGQISAEEAANHPNSNLLTGCLGTASEPPLTLATLGPLQVGDVLMSCSDGVWHYYTPAELGAVLHSETPREACQTLIERARLRAHGGGDNLSVAIVKVEAAPARSQPAPPLVATAAR